MNVKERNENLIPLYCLAGIVEPRADEAIPVSSHRMSPHSASAEAD